MIMLMLLWKRLLGGGYSSLEEEKADLSKLRTQYERTIEKKYSPYFVKTIKDKNNVTTDRNKWRMYSDTFKALIQNGLADTKTSHSLAYALLQKGIKNIGIYGDTEITKVLVTLLKGTDVNIAYIVENIPVNGIKTLHRSTPVYPPVDIMLVADVINYKGIEAKLAKFNLPFPVINAQVFLSSFKMT